MKADPLAHRTTPRTAAAYWLNHRRSGDMTAQEARAFQVWLDRDPENRAAYQELERMWGVLGAAVDDPEVIAARENDARTFDARIGLRWAAIAACALVLVGGGGVLGSGMLDNQTGPAPALSGFAARGDQGTQVGQGITEFRTSVGQRTTVTLPDRSVVTLDTDTILRMHHAAGERRVSLERGRAFFRVAKDPSRPFVVAAGDHLVRALGTAFDVRVDPDHFEVTLVEGRVKVETPSPERRRPATKVLRPGQRLAIEENAPKLVKVDLRTETSWHVGRLTFVRDPISDAVEEMNRYSEKKIIFRDGQAPDKSIIGVFRAGDVDSFAKAVHMEGLANITSETEDFIELSAN